MADYSLTKTRAFQWILIILVLAAIAGGYFYFQSRAAVTLKVAPGTGLIAYFPMDEGVGTRVEDHSGNANTGTPTNMESSDWVDGMRGKAMTFDGVNEYVTFGTTGQTTNNFTFGGWIRTSATHQIDTQTTDGTDGVYNQKYAFEPQHKGTDAGAGMSVGTNGISVYEHGASYMPALAVYSASIGTGWNHIMVVYSSKQPHIYLNGTLVYSGYTSLKSSVYSPIFMGGGPSLYGLFAGQMDEIRIYNRVLSATEITNLSQLGRGIPGTNEGSGQRRVFLTSGTSWTVPSDWNNSNNTIEAIGAGGNGSAGNTAGTEMGSGGGGGEYRKIANFSATPGASVSYAIAAGGSAADTTFNTSSLIAKPGGNASGLTAGAGGTGGTGAAGNANGGSGSGGGNDWASGGSGGGGAAGPNGVGRAGGSGVVNNAAGAGGGGAGGGSSTAGSSAPAWITGGNGGVNRNATGSGSGGYYSVGSVGIAGGGGGGGGGGGQANFSGGAGGNGTEWDASKGAGGGGGGGAQGGGANHGAQGGLYGGGGGGGGRNIDGLQGVGGAGAQGIIVITYNLPVTTLNKSPNSVLTSGLVGHWTFDGPDTTTTTATDRGTGGNNGTLTNGPAVIEGKLGQALSFDGSNDYVITPSFTVALNNVTYSAWIKLTSTSSTMDVIEKGTLRLRYVAGGGLQFFWGGGGSYHETSGITLTANQWYHVVGTINAGTYKVYVNGTQYHSGGDNTSDIPTGSLSIGAYAGGSNFVNGSIDDVRIYNTALSADEVTSLYNFGR